MCCNSEVSVQLRFSPSAETPCPTGDSIAIGLSMPNIFLVAKSPITSGEGFAVTLAVQTAKTFFIGPASGSPAVPTFRLIAKADLYPAFIDGAATNGWLLTLVDKTTGEFTWSAAPGGGATVQELAFNSTTDWGAASGGYYSISFTHGLNKTAVLVSVWDETSTPVMTFPEIIERTNNNTVRIRVPDLPDNRFAGRITVI